MSKYPQWKQVCSILAFKSVKVRKYRSEKTGLTIVIAGVDGPLVDGYTVVATEAFDDVGLPHTLEHLVFMGSEDYPFKGILDLLSNRCLASGTNAWTDTDHTCYTLNSVGSESFLQLLPIYIDHILFPLLTDNAYITEIHHVTEEGKDAGVVYCELQGTENSGEARVHLEMVREMYPKSAYSANTGGMMKDVRESLNNDKIKDYHKAYYRPENLTIILAGQLDEEDVFASLEAMETKIFNKCSKDPFERPWQRPVSPLNNSKDVVVPYASDEEDNGMVYVAWRGPRATDELYQLSACTILFKYLTDTSISPLQLEFVEIAEPLASSVGYSLQENSVSCLYLAFENVPVDKLSEIRPRLDAKFREIVNGDDPVDMTRMKTVIQRHKLETLLNMETQPHECLAFLIIGDVLYGQNIAQLEQRLNPVADLEKMLEEPVDFWIKLLKTYFLDTPSVTIRGKPSKEEAERQAVEEQMRIDEQIEKLGPEGLKLKGKQLQEAIALNEKKPTDDILTSIPIPSLRKVKSHKFETFRSDASPSTYGDWSQLPFHTSLTNLNSNFVYIFFMLDTSKISDDLRRYLPLLTECLLESAIVRDGQEIPYHQVVAELEKDTIATSSLLGIQNGGHFSCGQYCQVLTLTLQGEVDKFERCIRWLRELIFNIKLTPERVSIIASKLINEVSEFRRKGNKISNDFVRGIYFGPNTNYYMNNMIRQYDILNEFVSESADVTKLEVLLDELRKPHNMAIHIAANLNTLMDKFKEIFKPIKSILPTSHVGDASRFETAVEHTLLRPDFDKRQSCIIGLSSIESTFLHQAVMCINNFSDPDLPALFVFLQYLLQCEGPMWTKLRGLGLSYGYNISPRPQDGLLFLSFYRSTNVVAAYKETKNIIDNILSGEELINKDIFDSAKTSLTFIFVEREKNISDIVWQCVLAYFRNVDVRYNWDFIQKISQVTVEEAKQAGTKYVQKLFNPDVAKFSIVCHPSAAEEIAAEFRKMGFKLRVCNDLKNAFDEV